MNCYALTEEQKNACNPCPYCGEKCMIWEEDDSGSVAGAVRLWCDCKEAYLAADAMWDKDVMRTEWHYGLVKWDNTIIEWNNLVASRFALTAAKEIIP